MSEPESTKPRLGRQSTIPSVDPVRILLLDRTEARDELTRANSTATETERNDDEAVTTPLHKKLTSSSLGLQSVKNQVARQKYRRYDRDRYHLDDVNDPQTDTDSSQILEPDTSLSARPISYLDRTRTRAKRFLKRKKKLGYGKDRNDTALDILWENQRGSFLFGVPRYSANSLLPSDPKPWQNAQFRTSPVDIRNAQVPDPSWEWTWKSWYVDMSRDVDEEGWEYSLAFKINFSWHGNHPWFHSFVRRRRWLRMRTRKRSTQITSSNKQNPHDLASEYFTIHPQAQFASEAVSLAASISRSRTNGTGEQSEIASIGELMSALRQATLDREKLATIKLFLVNGGDEVRYMSDRMSNIMGMLVYQSSRRQVLADLIAMTQSGSKGKERLRREEVDNGGMKAGMGARASKDDLNNAVQAAKEELQRLEYWSDIKDMQEINTTDAHPRNGDIKVFASKQTPREPAKKLHKHPEHGKDRGINDDGCIEATNQLSSSMPPRLDSTTSINSEDGADLERYVTAAESASEMPSQTSSVKRKKKAAAYKHRPLGGVDEEET